MIDDYLHTARRLRRRYTVNERLVLSVGRVPSKYTRLERMAARRYLGIGAAPARATGGKP